MSDKTPKPVDTRTPHPQSEPGHAKPLPHLEEEADHTVQDEVPLGWDQAPLGTDQPIPHRHPRQAGLGGTTRHEEPLDEAQSDGRFEHPDQPDNKA